MIWNLSSWVLVVAILWIRACKWRTVSDYILYFSFFYICTQQVTIISNRKKVMHKHFVLLLDVVTHSGHRVLFIIIPHLKFQLNVRQACYCQRGSTQLWTMTSPQSQAYLRSMGKFGKSWFEQSYLQLACPNSSGIWFWKDHISDPFLVRHWYCWELLGIEGIPNSVALQKNWYLFNQVRYRSW